MTVKRVTSCLAATARTAPKSKVRTFFGQASKTEYSREMYSFCFCFLFFQTIRRRMKITGGNACTVAIVVFISNNKSEK